MWPIRKNGVIRVLNCYNSRVSPGKTGRSPGKTGRQEDPRPIRKNAKACPGHKILGQGIFLACFAHSRADSDCNSSELYSPFFRSSVKKLSWSILVNPRKTEDPLAAAKTENACPWPQNGIEVHYRSKSAGFQGLFCGEPSQDIHATTWRHASSRGSCS